MIFNLPLVGRPPLILLHGMSLEQDLERSLTWIVSAGELTPRDSDGLRRKYG